jgi:hypothetical protein
MKWRILLSMPSYPMDKQKMIVAVTMDFITSFMRIMQMIKILENVIGIRIMCRLYHQDIEDIMSPQNAGDTSTSKADDRTIDKFRDDIARAIFLSRS